MQLYLDILKLLKLLYPLIDQGKRLTADETREKSVKLREHIIKMGPTFIKLGQILSLRYDLFNSITCEELQILLDHQDKAIDFETVIEMLKMELGGEFTTIESISREPIAVASLGQVHLAKLKSNGQKVAIKIQKPNIREKMQSDLNSIKSVIRITEINPAVKKFDLGNMFGEFADWTLKELDFTVEAANVDRFRESLLDNPHVIVPKVYRNLTTNNVITTEFIEGISAKEFMGVMMRSSEPDVVIRGKSLNRNKIIKMVDEVTFEQIFINGIAHGDPHPSNIFIIDDEHMAYVDFGILLQFNKYQKMVIKQVIHDIVFGKREEIVKAMIAIDQKPGSMPADKILANLNPYFDQLETEVSENYNPTRFVIDLIYNCARADIEVPKFWVLLSKVMVTYDGILQALKPQASLMTELEPYFKKEESLKLFNFDFLKKDTMAAVQSAQSLFDLVTALPEESLKLLREVEVNGIKVNYIDKAGEDKNRVINRVTILVALIIASLGGFVATMFAAGPDSPASLIMLALVVIIVAISLFYLFKE